MKRTKPYLIRHDFLSTRLSSFVVSIKDVPDGSLEPGFEHHTRQREHRQLGAVPRGQAADVDVRVGREVSELYLAAGRRRVSRRRRRRR